MSDYSNVTIEDANRFGSLERERLAELERQIGTSLPDDYREFLLKYNGGRPEPDRFVIGGGLGKGILHQLFGIHDGPFYANMLRHLDMRGDRMPSTLLPIGSDPGGNLICISIGSEDKGAIYFWDHEDEADEGEEPGFDNVYLIADNFSDFLSQLTAGPEPEVDPLERASQTGDVKVIEQFLAAGGEVNRKNKYGRTLLHEAAIHGQLEILRLLIQSGADISGAISMAAQNGEADVVEYLIEQGADIEEVIDERADTPLMKAASFGHTEVVEALLKRGANVDARNKYGQTAIVVASWGEHTEIMHLLKAAGASPNSWMGRDIDVC